MKVGVIIDRYSQEIGGPYFIIKNQIDSLKKKINIKVIFNNGKRNINLNNIIKKLDICHFYGGWTYFYLKASLISIRLKKKIITNPLGFYEPWSLNQKRLKKIIAWNLYQKKILSKSDLIHCASLNEEKSLIKLHKSFKTILLPYGIKNNFIKNNIKKNTIKKKALFFSRIHKKKGIENLINAWNEIKPNGWVLDIIGPYEDIDYYLKLKKLSEGRNINFLNPVYEDQEKKKLFDQYDFLVLPTFNENFGMIILEALARGLPVLTNDNAPWQVIRDTNSGWFIKDDYKSLLSCLKKIFKTNIYSFRVKSFNAIKLARKFSWSKLSEYYYQVYKRMLNN